MTSVDPSWPAARVADGDSNGEVGLSDITPIGANFQSVVTGYQLQASATPTVESSWIMVGEIPFSAGALPAEGGPLQFSFELADPQTSFVYRVAPYYSDGGDVQVGIASNQRTYGSSPEVEQLLADAQEALLLGDGITARAKYEQVQQLAPDNPTAGFGLAFIAIMHEANDVVDFLSEYNDPLFRNVALVPVENLLAPVTRGRLWDSLSRVTLPRSASEIQLRDLTYAEIRAEIIAVIDVLTEITDQLDLALESMPDDWSLEVPEDWNSPLAGTITFTKPDALTLSALLDAAVGVLHFSIAYSGGSLGISETTDLRYIEITGLDGEFVDPHDLNEDGLIDMQEIFGGPPLPASAGVLNSDGRMRLTSFTTYTHRALTKAVDATELYLDQRALIEHWAYSMSPGELDEFEQDWDAYGRDYAADLLALWSTGTTLTVRPAALAAWPDLADDPGEDFSIAVNCAEFFAGLPADLRDFPIRFGYEGSGGELDCFLPEAVDDAFSDPTVLGLFPDGLTQEQYEIIFGRIGEVSLWR